MAVSGKFTAYLESSLSSALSHTIRLKHVSAVSGGSINAAYCLHTDAGDFMMKRNSKSAYPGMFTRESEGLSVICATQTIAVPRVILQGDHQDDSFLILEWIEATRTTPDTSRLLGKQLAAMHRHTAKQFGFNTDNYLGSLVQSNRRRATWTSFFIEERLQPMVRTAVDRNLLTPQDVARFEQLYRNLGNLFTEEPPALIHGDLWGGNYLIGAGGKPYLIDPAVTYGHRECDIALTILFGGFGHEFYQSYVEHFPLAEGWQQRVALWNLYPLLLHLNLFGGSYLGQVRSCLAQNIS